MICVAVLQRQRDEFIDDADGKGNIMMDTFFPPFQAEFDDLQDAVYPTPYQLGHITINKVVEVINQAPSFNAPGYDGIPNGILKASTRRDRPPGGC